MSRYSIYQDINGIANVLNNDLRRRILLGHMAERGHIPVDSGLAPRPYLKVAEMSYKTATEALREHISGPRASSLIL